jgi:hypothetical protein
MRLISLTDRQGSPCELDMFVIDVLRHDIEDLDAVLRMLNNTGLLGWRKFWPRDFTREEVLEALDRLVSRGLAKPLEYDPVKRELVTLDRPVDVRREGGSLWYTLEQSALDLWNEWKSPKESLN